MDTRTLKQFVILADTLHFGRASEACHVSASALSRSIKQLEGEVGVKLLERDNRSVELTRHGEQFLEFARDSLTQWDVLRNALLEDADALRGEVSIYCSVTASYSFLFDLLSEFRRDYPRIEIKLHTGDPEHAVQRVLAGEEDIAIGARPRSLPATLAFKPMTDTPLVFIAAANSDEYTSLSGGKAYMDDWQRTPMILSETGLARRRVDSWFRALGMQPQIYAQVAGNEAIVSMVSLGFGVGVVPRIVLDNSPLASNVRVLDVRPKLESYAVGLFALRKKLKSPLIEAFWSQIR
ncbi:MAG: HTH-type transcriptional activator IlvY [Gammaproteobacteria bacterium]|nr:HTH-type transcriptional activator IlvY [Gammaproteobacteria bacterium]NND37707.1 HTH-type transcriptional activator IlvY [Gammaproteobacteria bacterium]